MEGQSVTTDVALVLGILFLFLMMPAAVSDFAAGRPPRRVALLFTIGGALVIFALTTSRTGYQAGDLPEVLMRVIGQIIH